MVAIANKKQDEAISQKARTALATGMSGLQFAASLEQQFEAWYRHRYLALNRVYLLAGAFAMAVLTASAKVITPSIFDQVLQIRIPVIALILIVYALSHLQSTLTRIPVLLCLIIGALHGSMLMTAFYAAETGYFHYQSEAIVIIIFSCLMLKLQFHFVLPLAILLWFTQVLGMYFLMIHPFAEFIEVFVLYTVITIISLLVCFRSEYEERRFFILQSLLCSKSVQPTARPATNEEAGKDNLTELSERPGIPANKYTNQTLND